MKFIWLGAAVLFSSIDASTGGLVNGLTSALSPVAGVPGNMRATDLNGDGKPDILVPETATGWLAVRLNNGDGSFGPVTRYKVGLLPSFITVGDFNHDGKVDVAVSNAGSGDVSVLLGRGNGTFSAAVSYPVSGSSAANGLPTLGEGTFSLVTGDFNGDGIPDIVASGTGTLNLKVLLGKGDGTFEPGENLSSLGIGPQCFSVADLNGDHKEDIAVVNSSSLYGVGDLAILLGRGDGTFIDTAANASYPLAFIPWATAVADFNGDGIPDIAVANGFPAVVSILFGNGDGTFRPQVEYPM